VSTIALVPPVTLGSQALPASWLDALIDLKVECVFQAPARATLRFVDPAYVLASSELAEPGANLVVTDPSGGERRLFIGEVTGVGVDQRAGEQPELVLVAHDRSHRLARQATARSYSQTPYSEVVAKLCDDAGLDADVTATEATEEYLMQADSDLGLITELARRIGYDWWVTDTTLHFAPPSAGPTVRLALGTTLRSFSARANAQPPTTVKVAGWDRSAQEVVTSVAGSDAASPAVLASSPIAERAAKRTQTLGAATVFTAGLGVGSSSEAGTVSSAILDRIAASAVRASGLADGNASIALGATVEVSDAGPLSGSYPVTRVEHVYRARSGFVTRFWSGDRQPTTLADTLGSLATPHATFSATGLTVGVVTGINDPDAMGRVRVLYPGLGNQYTTGWARVASPGGGKTRGGVFVPEVGDEVLIGFECSDPRRPVVIGGLFGDKSTTPPPGVKDGTVQQRSITSRLGHVVSLLDGTVPGEQAIELTLAGGQHTLHLGKDNVTLSVPSGQAVTIKAGDTQVSFGTDGSVNVKGTTVTLQATNKVAISAPQVQVSADAQLTLQSTASASLQADAELQVGSDGPTAIKGAVVQIN
jgi:uncharacterized protein involved in type VI secretion and phage assembly